LYHIPVGRGDVEAQPFERWPVDPREYESFHLSDPITPSIGLDHPNIRPASGPPPPISLFCRTLNPVGIVHYLIWPKIEATPDQPTRYYFNLEYVVPQTVHVSEPLASHVLTGSSKALLYTVGASDRTDTPRLLSIRRYLSPQLQPLWSLREMEDPTEPVSRRDRPGLSKRYYVRSDSDFIRANSKTSPVIL
jgi:hypothetical protein